MISPVCLPCRKMFGKKKNGVPLEEGMPRAGGEWGSYKLWMGDLWQCEGCGAEIVVGFGLAPVAEHYQANYPEMLARFGNPPRIDDCPHMYRGPGGGG